jgi:hypothetical protein
MPIAINGSGTITGISAGGLPDATITQAELASGVAGNGPAFSAYASGATNTATATFTKIQLAAEEFDTANCFDTSLSRFTPNVAGYYQFNGAVYAAAYVSQLTSIYKNGSEFRRGTQNAAATVSNITIVSTLIYMNGTTDYVELYWYQGSGSTVNTLTGSQYTYFNGFLARAA